MRNIVSGKGLKQWRLRSVVHERLAPFNRGLHLPLSPLALQTVHIERVVRRIHVAFQNAIAIRPLAIHTEAGTASQFSILNTHENTQRKILDFVHACRCPGIRDPYTSPLIVAPVLSGQSHLLVHKDLAAEGVESKADGDSNNDSCDRGLVGMTSKPAIVWGVIPNGTNSGGICLNLRRRCEMVWARRRDQYNISLHISQIDLS